MQGQTTATTATRNRKPAIDAGAFADQAAEHFATQPAGKLFIPKPPTAINALGIGNTVSYDYDGLAEAFPDVDPGLEPFGSLVLVMIRQPKSQTGGGVILDTETRKTDHYNTTIAKVLKVGPLAFHNRNTGEPWPEGAWAKIGDFVRVPRYGGDRWTIDYSRPDFEIDAATGAKKKITVTDEAHFALFKDMDLRGRFTGDPLKVKAFIS